MAYRGITHILPCRILLSSPSTGPLAPNLRQVTPLCVGVCSAPCLLPVVIPAGGAPADRSRLAPLPHWLDRLYNPPTYPPPVYATMASSTRGAGGSTTGLSSIAGKTDGIGDTTGASVAAGFFRLRSTTGVSAAADSFRLRS